MLKKLIFKKAVLVLLVSVSFLGAIGAKNSSNKATAMELLNLEEELEETEVTEKKHGSENYVPGMVVDIFDLEEICPEVFVMEWAAGEYDNFDGTQKELKNTILFKLKNPYETDLVISVTKDKAQERRMKENCTFKHVEIIHSIDMETEDKHLNDPGYWYDKDRHNVTDRQVTLKPGEEIGLELLYVQPACTIKRLKNVQEIQHMVEAAIKEVEQKIEKKELGPQALLKLIDEKIKNLEAEKKDIINLKSKEILEDGIIRLKRKMEDLQDGFIDIFDLKRKESGVKVGINCACEKDSLDGTQKELKYIILFKIKNISKKDLVISVTKDKAQERRMKENCTFKHVEIIHSIDKKIEEKHLKYPGYWYDKDIHNVTDRQVTLKPGEEIDLELLYVQPASPYKRLKNVQEIEQIVNAAIKNVEQKIEKKELGPQALLKLINEKIRALKMEKEIIINLKSKRTLEKGIELLNKKKEELKMDRVASDDDKK